MDDAGFHSEGQSRKKYPIATKFYLGKARKLAKMNYRVIEKSSNKPMIGKIYLIKCSHSFNPIRL